MNLNAKPYEPPVQPTKSPVNVYTNNTFIPIPECEVDLYELYIFLTNNSAWQLKCVNYIKSYREHISNKDYSSKYYSKMYREEIDYRYRCVSMNWFFVGAIIDYIKKQVEKKNIQSNPEQNTSGLLLSEITIIKDLVEMKKKQTQNIMSKF
jgi:hypothetical protein